MEYSYVHSEFLENLYHGTNAFHKLTMKLFMLYGSSEEQTIKFNCFVVALRFAFHLVFGPIYKYIHNKGDQMESEFLRLFSFIFLSNIVTCPRFI